MPLKIAVDIDGVLADQVTPILKQLNKKYSITFTKVDIKKWDQKIENTTIDVEIEKALLDPEYVLSMPIITGAKEAMKHLYRNHHITIATSRPKETEDATKKWLLEHFEIHDFCNTKGKIKADCVSSDLLIDDYIPNIETFAIKRGLGLLFSQPWNQDRAHLTSLIAGKRVFACDNWLDVISFLTKVKKHP